MGKGCTLATPALVGCGVPREQGPRDSVKAQESTGAKSGAPGWKAAAERAVANSEARENDFALAKRVIEIWETRPSAPEEHVRKAAHALFAWHNCVVHPMLVSEPRVGQLLHRITAEILIEVDPDYFYSELGPDGRRAYVPGGELPDNLEYQLAKRLMALLTEKSHEEGNKK